MFVSKSKYVEVLNQLREKEQDLKDKYFEIQSLKHEVQRLEYRIGLLDRMDKANTVDALIANIEASGNINALSYEVLRECGYARCKFNGEAYIKC